MAAKNTHLNNAALTPRLYLAPEMRKEKTLVIYNPISGTGGRESRKKALENALQKYFSHFKIVETTGPIVAIDLAKEAASQAYEIVIAAGGDGTINEVVSGLIGSKVSLGFIPIGSGNGLARHLGYSEKVRLAVEQLSQAYPLKIDVGLANKKPFLNVAGLGYDAEVAHDFARRPGRGLWNYLMAVLHTYRRSRSRKFKIKIEDQKHRKRALMLSVANGSQFGNNAYIAPQAQLCDGLLDLTLLYRFPNRAAPSLVWQLFNQELDRSRYTETIRVRRVSVKQKSTKAHLDGEPVILGKKVEFEVLPGALNILAPKAYRDGKSAGNTLGGSK